MRRLGIQRWIILLALPFLAAASDALPPSENVATRLLESKAWAVRTYLYEGKLVDSTGPRINAFIKFKEGKVDWQPACGRPWGKYRAEGDNVAMQVSAILRGLCIDREQPQWRAIEQALTGNLHVISNGDDGLTIIGPDHTVRVTLTSHLSPEGQMLADTRELMEHADKAERDHDDEQAFAWYLQAAQKGNPTAELAVANVYAFGQTLPRNPDEGRRWFQIVIDQGGEFAKEAQEALARMKR